MVRALMVSSLKNNCCSDVTSLVESYSQSTAGSNTKKKLNSHLSFEAVGSVVYHS